MSYTFKEYNKESMARANGVALPISLKFSVEICRFLKDKKINDAKEILTKVIKKKIALPFKTYNADLCHKKNIGPGRYPMKASGEFIKLIESVEANAQFKGLNTSNLVIAHICANQVAKALHQGRHSRRKFKRTNLEIVVKEKLK